MRVSKGRTINDSGEAQTKPGKKITAPPVRKKKPVYVGCSGKKLIRPAQRINGSPLRILSSFFCTSFCHRSSIFGYMKVYWNGILVSFLIEVRHSDGRNLPSDHLNLFYMLICHALSMGTLPWIESLVLLMRNTEHTRSWKFISILLTIIMTSYNPEQLYCRFLQVSTALLKSV